MSEYRTTNRTCFWDDEYNELQNSNSKHPPVTEQYWENGLELLPHWSQMREPTPNIWHFRHSSLKDSNAGDQFHFSLLIFNRNELLGKVLGHISCARVPEWREIEESMKSHIQSTVVFVAGRGGAGFHFVTWPLLRPGVNSLPFLPTPYNTGPWPGCGAGRVFYFPRWLPRRPPSSRPPLLPLCGAPLIPTSDILWLNNWQVEI